MREPCEMYDPDCYGCQLRNKGITIPPSATPSRIGRRPHRPIKQPSWEKGRVTEKRPGGFEMPVLNSKGTPMTVHEAQSNRKDIRNGMRAAKRGVTRDG